MQSGPTSDAAIGPPVTKDLGWQVAFAGLGINLALGVLYSWSIIAGGIEESGWDWSGSADLRGLPYAVACLVFCLIMVPAGRLQDRFGPRLVATLGGLLVGAGMILASRSTTVTGYVVGFGVLTGAGIGFGYASATPPAVKWFPPAKTGMIAGIVVSGFGLASVYIAPLGNWLIGAHGLQTTVLAFGVGFLVAVVALAQFLKPPHRVMQFTRGLGRAGEMKTNAASPVKKENFTPREMLKTRQFYLLWFMYACGAGAGLMIISVAKKIGAGAQVGVALVTGLAVGNGVGRILAGVLSDKIGRKPSMCGFFVLQAILVFLLSVTSHSSVLGSGTALVAMAAIIGANYGANLSLFPAVTKDFYGLKNFGMNYGLVFTAWGVGGFMLARVAGMVYDSTKSFNFAYYTAAVMLLLAAGATFALRAPHHHEEPAIAETKPHEAHDRAQLEAELVATSES